MSVVQESLLMWRHAFPSSSNLTGLVMLNLGMLQIGLLLIFRFVAGWGSILQY